jgi:hypothetical protein
MERRFEEKDSSDPRELNLVDSIKSIAAYNARAELDTEEQLLLYLQSWWSRLYNRPLKDPLLLSYSLEELLYEFYDRIERAKAEEERFEQESDKIEVEKEQKALDWAEQMEMQELKEMEAKASSVAGNTVKDEPTDPTKDPDNVTWMEDQLQQAKQLYGDSFGENISENFDE